ncbi:MAG: type II toxin-antitoxin system RatA family toxin [Acidiferrobacterales bacterium]
MIRCRIGESPLPTYSDQRKLPYSNENMFDLVADIERYPEFLAGWLAADIRQRDGDVLYVDQALGLGILRLRFSSRAVLRRPERIDIASTDGPFERFDINWQFEPISDLKCLLHFRLSYRLRSSLVEIVTARFLSESARAVVTSFERRAAQLYGSSK